MHVLFNKQTLNYTDCLVDRLSTLQSAMPDEEEICQATSCLIDYTAVTLSGLKAMFTEENITWMKDLYYSSSTERAFLLGMGGHWLELDDGYRKGSIHIGSSVLSALIAGVNRGVSDDDFIRGIVCGYESAARVAVTIQPSHKRKGFHTTGTCGALGATAGLAIAARYDRRQLKRSLSAAATSSSGILEVQEDGSNLKPANVGFAAMHGVVAAGIGKTCFAYPKDALGGKRGMLSCMSESRMEEWSEPPIIHEIYRKIYPSCRHGHPAIDAARQINQKNRVTKKTIKKVEVWTYQDAIAGHDHVVIADPSEAMMSIPFCVASALIDGNVTLQSFQFEIMERDEIKTLIQNIDIIEDEALSQMAPSKRGARLKVLYDDNTIDETTVLFPHGEPENPLLIKEIEEKAVNLLQWSGFPKTRVEEMISVSKNVYLDPRRYLSLFEQMIEVVIR